MIENLKYLGFIFKILRPLKTIYRCIKEHRVDFKIPSRSIRTDKTENKIRFLLRIENGTFNTIKIEELTYSYKTGSGIINLKKETKQVGIANSNILCGNPGQPHYDSQNLFSESDKKDIRIDPESKQTIDSCYVNNIKDKSVMIKIKYRNIGIRRPFIKTESIYLPI